MIPITASLFLICLLFGQLIRIPFFSGGTLYLHDVMLGLFIITVVCTGRVQQLWKRSYILGMPLGIVVGILSISLVLQLPHYPWQEVLSGGAYLFRFMFYALLYFIVQNSMDGRFWIRGLYVVGVGMAVLGIGQFIVYPDLRNLMYLGWDPHYYRLFSTLLDPNYMGILLLSTGLLGFVVWQKKGMILPFLSQGLVGVAYLLTFSRSAYLSGFVALFLFGVMKKQWRYLFLGIFFIAFLLVVPKQGGYSSSLLRTETAIARIGNWQESMDFITTAPVFGHGFNMLRSIQTPEWQKKPEETLSHAASGVDNSFLFVTATSGILGLGSLLFLLWRMRKLGIMRLQTKKTSILGLVYLLSLVVLCVDSLFINSLFYPWMMIWIWILSGVVEQGDVR